MKITLLSDERIRLDGKAGPLSVEAESAEMQYSPFHMLASGLATCTYSVLASWGTHAKLPVDDLSIEVGWTFAENPHRVGNDGRGRALAVAAGGAPQRRRPRGGALHGDAHVRAAAAIAVEIKK